VSQDFPPVPLRDVQVSPIGSTALNEGLRFVYRLGFTVPGFHLLAAIPQLAGTLVKGHWR
jgi:hypothetical protein